MSTPRMSGPSVMSLSLALLAGLGGGLLARAYPHPVTDSLFAGLDVLVRAWTNALRAIVLPLIVSQLFLAVGMAPRQEQPVEPIGSRDPSRVRGAAHGVGPAHARRRLRFAASSRIGVTRMAGFDEGSGAGSRGGRRCSQMDRRIDPVEPRGSFVHRQHPACHGLHVPVCAGRAAGNLEPGAARSTCRSRSRHHAGAGGLAHGGVPRDHLRADVPDDRTGGPRCRRGSADVCRHRVRRAGRLRWSALPAGRHVRAHGARGVREGRGAVSARRPHDEVVAGHGPKPDARGRTVAAPVAGRHGLGDPAGGCDAQALQGRLELDEVPVPGSCAGHPPYAWPGRGVHRDRAADESGDTRRALGGLRHSEPPRVRRGWYPGRVRRSARGDHLDDGHAHDAAELNGLPCRGRPCRSLAGPARSSSAVQTRPDAAARAGEAGTASGRWSSIAALGRANLRRGSGNEG